MKKIVNDDIIYDIYTDITGDERTSFERACPKMQDALSKLEKDDHDFFMLCVRHKKLFQEIGRIHKLPARSMKKRYNEIVVILKTNMK